MKKYKIRSAVLMAGDLTVFYIGLFLTLLIRYGLLGEFEKWWGLHILPFSTLFAVWLLIFAASGLYDPFLHYGRQTIRERIFRTMILAGAISIIIFYIWPQAGITPKTNLLIDVAITMVLLLGWRKLYESILAKADKTRIIFFGWSHETRELSDILRQNPHLGYEPAVVVLPEGVARSENVDLPIYVFNHFPPEIIREKNINLIVASHNMAGEKGFIKMAYEVLPMGVAYVNFPEFYERITGKVPVSMISEMWFLENLAENEKRIFEAAKRAFDMAGSLILGLVAAILFLPAALAVKISSPGPVFFRQRRVGKNGGVFELVKFRSTRRSEVAKTEGWQKEESKDIYTKAGKFLRKSYLDELPQAWSILKGDMSLIGPRPERPEFVEELKKEVPHYMMRLLVRPGITGWAQINMRYDASAKDALEKLQYDLYYIKNRSVALDASIAVKTLFTMLSHPGK